MRKLRRRPRIQSAWRAFFQSLPSPSQDREPVMFDTNQDITILNSLIETTIDSIDGYRRSAEEATNERFAASFRDRAEERERVVAKLRDRVRALGGTPEEDGGLLAAMHRQFLSLRDAVTGTDDHAVIAE